MSKTKEFDGSRRHVLDWVESATFVDTVREWVRDQGFTIPADAAWMPKSWAEPDESRLFDADSPFLDEDRKTELQRWWLAHSGNIPNWDLIVAAVTTTGNPAVVLVEAKAHASEFDCKPKPVTKRDTPDAQKRTDENHEQIRKAIGEASHALSRFHADISISRDRCYQLSNRLATAWKLASMGIPSALVFLGFVGDREIAKEGNYFSDDAHWQKRFNDYAAGCFPSELIGKDIQCAAAPFRLISKSLAVQRASRPIAERRHS